MWRQIHLDNKICNTESTHLACYFLKILLFRTLKQSQSEIEKKGAPLCWECHQISDFFKTDCHVWEILYIFFVPVEFPPNPGRLCSDGPEQCHAHVAVRFYLYLQKATDSEWQTCSSNQSPPRKSGWGQAATQPHPSGCCLEAAWRSRRRAFCGGRSMESGRGLARCIRPPTERDTDWTQTRHQAGFFTLRLHSEASHLELWGWGGGEEGAAAVIGREAGEDKEEEEEAGRGEEPLHPSDKAWTLSDKHTGPTTYNNKHNDKNPQ